MITKTRDLLFSWNKTVRNFSNENKRRQQHAITGTMLWCQKYFDIKREFKMTIDQGETRLAV